MQTLFQSSHGRVRDYRLPDPEPQERITLRVIAWLIFALLTIGGTYLYFDRPVTIDPTYLRQLEVNHEIRGQHQALCGHDSCPPTVEGITVR